MLKDFLSFFNSIRKISKNDSILLAISGGKDSMVLLDLFLKAGFSNISVAHCNFQLRGEASDLDELFVKEYCIKHEVKCHTIQFETKSIAIERKISIEMAARDLRYEWFGMLKDANDIKFLVTAHHLNDNLETILLSFTKGIGVTGLAGIPEGKNNILRPLLNFKREEIDEYASAFNVNWREDHTNAELNYSRNKIRNLVLPVLKEINPGLENTFLKNLSRFKALGDVFQGQLKAFETECVLKDGDLIGIDHSRWKRKPGFELFVEEYLRKFGFNFDQVQSILKLKDNGKRIISDKYEIIKHQHLWLISEKVEYSFFEHIPDLGKYKFEGLEINLQLLQTLPSDFKKSKSIYLDFEKIKWPLLLRSWEPGDKIQPLGMKGKKLVSDILIDAKMNLVKKKKQLILENKNDILWLVNLRINEKFKVSAATKSILEVSAS